MVRFTRREDIEGPPATPPTPATRPDWRGWIALRRRRPQGHGHAPATRPDWRGWIALAWVVFWGSAYAVTAIQARAPQILQWLRHLAGKLLPS